MSKKDLIVPVQFIQFEEPEKVVRKEPNEPKKSNISIEIENKDDDGEELADFSISNFLSDGDDIYVEPVDPTPISSKPKTKRKKVNTKSIGGKDVIVSEEEDSSKSSGGLAHLQTDIPYQETYTDSMIGLDHTISQLDELTGAVRMDLEELRNNPKLRGRHRNISEMTSSMSNLLSTKIAAIRERNSIISKSHDLDLKRIKDLNLNAVNEVDHDRAIQDVYNSFISMPTGGGNNAYMPPSMNAMTDPAGMGNNIVTQMVGQDTGFEAYQENIGPVQNMMRYEDDPNVKTVVKYNPTTGHRAFDIINIKTNESIPNLQRPDNMFLEDTTIDVNQGVARNANIDEVYPLIMVGGATEKY